MNNKFEQISLKPGFMKHNGGILFKNLSANEYQFKTTINENHLNAAGITHGGFIAALVDAGVGTASDATIAMELGCDGVLINTAIAEAKNPVLMAESMKAAVISGRKAFRAGRMKKRLHGGNPSSPTDNLI